MTDLIVIRGYTATLVLGVPPGAITESYDSAFFAVRDTIRPAQYRLHYLHRAPYFSTNGFIPPDSIVFAEYGSFDLTLYVLHDVAIVDSAVMHFWGYQTGLDVKDDPDPVFSELSVNQNYPNPFNHRTIIRFYLARPSMMEINVYDLLGHRVQTIENGYFDLGEHSLPWEPEELPSGVYLLQVKSPTTQRVVSSILLK